MTTATRHQTIPDAVREAIEDGQRSAFCRAFGFSLVVDDAGEYHPRRLDKPIGAKERVIAHLAWFQAGHQPGRWVVHDPPMRSADMDLLDALIADRVRAARFAEQSVVPTQKVACDRCGQYLTRRGLPAHQAGATCRHYAKRKGLI